MSNETVKIDTTTNWLGGVDLFSDCSTYICHPDVNKIVHIDGVKNTEIIEVKDDKQQEFFN